MLRVLAALGIFAFALDGQAAIVDYDASVMPESAGFERTGTFDVDRWLSEGWFSHHVELGQWSPPPMGEEDFYHHSLGSFVGDPFFAEWRVLSDAPDSEVHHNNGAALITFVGGGVSYHFNMSSGMARLLRGVPYPTVYFDITPGVPHDYHLEVYGADYYELQIDGVIVDAGEPEGDFPTPDGLMAFGTQFYMAESTSSWDYARFGTIPEPATGVLLLTASLCALAFRRGLSPGV